MSSCIIFQQNQNCYLASDGAVSVKFGDKNIRIKDDYKKTFKYGDSLVFCSGKMSVVEKIIKDIKSNLNLTVEEIKYICKKYFNDNGNLELFLVTYKNNIISYQLSSYNEFEIIKRVVANNHTEILSLGFNSDKNLNKVFDHIGRHVSMEKLIESVYMDISCSEVGGIVDIFNISKEGVLDIATINLNDGYCIDNLIKNNDKNLLVGETIVGRIIAGHKLLIGNENNTMVIDENGIAIEGNCLSIKGVDGTNKDFNSYITMLSDQISLGVENSKEHTNAQFKILSDSITAKVSKGGEFATEFKQTATDFNFTIGNNGTNIKLDKNGQTIKNGGLTVTNSNGTVVIDGSSNMFKIHSVVEVNLDAGSNLDYIYRIPHNFGYVPAYLAYQVGTYSTSGDYTNTLLPAQTVGGLGDQLWFSSIIRANADENNIIINFKRANTTVTQYFRIKVFILREALI